MEKAKHDHYGHRARIRHRVKHEGLDHFQDYQVLEYALSFVIPYKDTNPIAHALINKFGGLDGVLEADEEDLKELNGMGEVSANFLTSIIKIYNYYEKTKSRECDIIHTPNDSYNYAKKLFIGKPNEEVYLISLLPNNKILKTEKISQGIANQASISIRKISDIMARNKVNSVIIVHNHPQGTSEPSKDDDKFTKALMLSTALNNSDLIDHIIVGENDYYSYKRMGKLEEFKLEIAGFLNVRNISQPMLKYGDEYEKK